MKANYIILLAVFFPLSFFGQVNQGTNNKYYKKLLGKWCDITHYYYEENIAKVSNEPPYCFNLSNNSILITDSLENITYQGNWEVKGKKIFLYDINEEKDKGYKVKFYGNDKVKIYPFGEYDFIIMSR